jgi:electron transfer flavoprotein beta subunit
VVAGLESIEIDLPAVVTTDLRLNEPRYIKLPDIMKAKKKPLDVSTLAQLGIEPGGPALRAVKFAAPPARSRGVMVKDVSELLGALKQRGVL